MPETGDTAGKYWRVGGRVGGSVGGGSVVQVCSGPVFDPNSRYLLGETIKQHVHCFLT